MKLIILILSCVVISSAMAQQFYTVDLSKTNFDEPTIRLNFSGIKLINALYNKEYKVTITVTQEKGAGDEGSFEVRPKSCEDGDSTFARLKSRIEEAKEEKDLPEPIDSLKSHMKTLSGPCKEELTKIGNFLLSQTERTILFLFDLKENQNINIKISRVGSNKSWELILRTPRSVNYISHFGFTFSPNWVKTPTQYFSKLTGRNISNTDSFTITKLNSNGKDFWKDLSLTANFLIPLKLKKKGSESVDLTPAWLAGIGVGGDARFTIFTGPALLFEDFTAIGLVFGVNYSHRLKGEYEPGQGLKEQLSFDQLHVRGIRPDIMVTLSFRLSKKQLQGGDIENIGGK